MKLLRRTFLQLAGAATAAPTFSRVATAQSYPSRPITVIVPFAAGGGADAIGRIVTERMRASLGQPFVIEIVATTGATWTDQTGASTHRWQSITSSADGTRLAALFLNGDIYTSSDSGVTWTDRTAAGTRNWYSIASSADGMKLAANVFGGYIYTSADGGATWTAQTSAGTRNWYPITISADGTRIAVADYGGDIWTGQLIDIAPQPVLGGNGPIAGTYNGNESMPGYVKPRAQIRYADGHVEYLDASSTSSLSATSTPTFAIANNHHLGAMSPDIKLLQQFLNTHGFVIAQSGPGSPGSETNYFGKATLQAFINFQKANALPATGYLRPLTRTLISQQNH